MQYRIFIFLTLLVFGNFQKEDFAFQKGNQSIELKIIGRNKYLSINRPTKLKLKTSNIDIERLTVAGKGLLIVRELKEEKGIVFEVKVKEGIIDNGKWKMSISAWDENNKIWHHQFLLNVK